MCVCVCHNEYALLCAGEIKTTTSAACRPFWWGNKYGFLYGTLMYHACPLSKSTLTSVRFCPPPEKRKMVDVKILASLQISAISLKSVAIRTHMQRLEDLWQFSDSSLQTSDSFLHFSTVPGQFSSYLKQFFTVLYSSRTILHSSLQSCTVSTVL